MAQFLRETGMRTRNAIVDDICQLLPEIWLYYIAEDKEGLELCMTSSEYVYKMRKLLSELKEWTEYWQLNREATNNVDTQQHSM